MKKLTFERMTKIEGGKGSPVGDNWSNGVCFGYLNLMVKYGVGMDKLVKGFWNHC